MEIPLALAIAGGNPIPRVGDKINIGDGDTAATVTAVYPNFDINKMGDNPDNYEHFIIVADVPN